MVANASSKPMIITAKYVSVCKACGRQVEPGDRVEWVRGDKFVSHVQCTDAGRAHVAAVEASRAQEPKEDARPIPCPEGLEYRPFQVAGIQHALSLPEGVLIADEMGLGKSIETAGYANATEDAIRILVVCPASVKINWQRELEKWLVERVVRKFTLDMETGLVGMTHVKGAPEVCLFPLIGDVTIVSSAMLSKVPGYIHWDLLVVDEVQQFKNQKTARSEHLTAIRARSALVLALTGTPVPNKTIELFPILQLVAPEEWDPPGMGMRKVDGKKTYVPVGAGGGAGFFKFAKRYAGAHQEWVSKTKQVWIFDGASNLDELNEKLRTTCMVRRLKKDVLAELPPKERRIICLPSEDDKRFVDAENKALATVLKTSTLDEAAKAMSAVKVEFSGYSKARLDCAKAKVEQVVEHVATALDGGSEKVILFAHHHAVVDELCTQLAPYGVVVVTGDTRQGTGEGERQWAVDKFQSDLGTRVIVGSIGAMGVGLTLTASTHVVFAELPMRPDELSQAEDRAHRIGQLGSVLVDILVYDGSVDAHIARMLVAKQDVADMALDAETIKDISGRPVEAGGLSYAAAKQKAYEDAGLTPKECAQLLAKMQFLAGQCDGAVQQDGHGFSKFDAGIGHALAECKTLSPKQALCARKLATKYRRQLDGRPF